jgi:hypothetical protein
MPTAWQIIRSICWLILCIGLLVMLFKYLVPPCPPFLPNNYEHFASDPNAIDQSLINSMTSMIKTLQTLQTDLEDKVDNIGDMKVQTCSVYDQYHNNYIQSKGAEAPNESEYSLPPEQQIKLQQNRMHYAEKQWAAKVQFFQTFKKQTMLDCSKVSVSGTPTANFKEGFANPLTNQQQLDTLSYQLQELVAEIKSIFTAKSGAGWAKDCEQITGTANFTNQQINVTLQGLQNPPKKTEGFASNSFPIPFPILDLSAQQLKYYRLLSEAQDLVNTYQSAFSTTYQTTQQAYTTMNSTYQSYLGYVNQLNNANNVAQAIPTPDPPAALRTQIP